MNDNKNNIDPLGKDPIFRWTLILGTVFCAATSLHISIANNLSFCWGQECYSNLLAIFDFPVKAGAAFLTLAGFRALIFRSKQTSIQIEAMFRQNTYSNYLTHKKEFMTILESIEKQNYLEDRRVSLIKFKSKETLYSDLFPNNTSIHFEFESTGVPESILSIDFDSYVERLKEIGSLTDAISSGDDTEENYKRFALVLSGFMSIFRNLHIDITGKQQVDSLYHTYFKSVNLDPQIPQRFSLISQNLAWTLEIMITNLLPSKEIKPDPYPIFDSEQQKKIEGIMHKLTVATKFSH